MKGASGAGTCAPPHRYRVEDEMVLYEHLARGSFCVFALFSFEFMRIPRPDSSEEDVSL